MKKCMMTSLFPQGIEKDLGMTGFDYNIALTIFYLFVRHIPS
jgi:hypothetical protein